MAILTDKSRERIEAYFVKAGLFTEEQLAKFQALKKARETLGRHVSILLDTKNSVAAIKVKILVYSIGISALFILPFSNDPKLSLSG